MIKCRELTELELSALIQYANENGISWKARLNNDWMKANCSPILQSLRNSHGPSWLKQLVLKR